MQHMHDEGCTHESTPSTQGGEYRSTPQPEAVSAVVAQQRYDCLIDLAARLSGSVRLTAPPAPNPPADSTATY